MTGFFFMLKGDKLLSVVDIVNTKHSHVNEYIFDQEIGNDIKLNTSRDVSTTLNIHVKHFFNE